MTIRGAKPEDKPALFLLARAFATSFEVEQPAFDQAFDELLTHPEALLMVAEADGTVGARSQTNCPGNPPGVRFL
jgi:hypothetical protein